MNPDYVRFNNYDPEATIRLVPSFQMKKALHRIENAMLFFSEERPELLDQFADVMYELIKSHMKSGTTAMFEEFEPIIKEFEILQKYRILAEWSLKYILELLDLPSNTSRDEQEIDISYLSAERAENWILYQIVKTMVEIKGRKDGILLYKSQVEYSVRNSPVPTVDSFSTFRRNIEDMSKSGGFKYAVHDFDDDMFLAKFDNCVVYDSLRDADDPELGYYAVCYLGMMGGLLSDWCVRMRRTQTLFSGDFCDELYWNRHVHDEPEQPSLEFSRRLVID